MFNICIRFGSLVLLDMDLLRREEDELVECEGCEKCEPPAKEPVGFKLEEK